MSLWVRKEVQEVPWGIEADPTTIMKKGIDYIGVNCCFVCHDGQGRILLHKRSVNCRDEQGCWDSGAGALEHGETFEEGVRREVREEYGVEPMSVTYVRTRNLIRPHADGRSHWVVNLHLVEVDPEQVSIGEPDKMDEIGWFDIDHLPQPLHSAFIDDLSQIKHLLVRTTFDQD